MPKLVIKGKNIDVTPSLRDFITKKLSKLDRYAKHIIEVSVEMHVEKNPRISENQTVDVNVFVNGGVIRAEESSHDMYASIDMVLDKLERQMKKYEEKKVRNRTGKLKIGSTMNEEYNEFQPFDEFDSDSTYSTY